MSKRKCFGHCYKYRDCEACPDFDDCYTATAKKSAEGIWGERPDVEQMINDVKWLSNAALNRTPSQNQFMELLRNVRRMIPWLAELKKQMDWFKGKADQLDAIIKLHPVAGDITVKTIVEKFNKAELFDANLLLINQFAIIDGKHYWKGEELETMKENAEKYDDTIDGIKNLIKQIDDIDVAYKEAALARLPYKIMKFLEAKADG